MASAPQLPADDHTHSEWSWDAHAGSMAGSCARAVELGLPAIAFTEHVDATRWVLADRSREELVRDRHLVGEDGRFDPPPLDVDRYLASVDDCRARFPQLAILTGVELGEPHRFRDRIAPLLASGGFERVLGSLHSVEFHGLPWLVDDAMSSDGPEDATQEAVLRSYLGEAAAMVADLPDEVQVLAHIDYPLRGWRGPFDPAAYEEPFRHVLTTLAASGRALEVSTRVPLAPEIVAWWREVGGRAVSFASDAHEPSAVGHGFAAAAEMVEASGFRRDRHPHGFWHR